MVFTCLAVLLNFALLAQKSVLSTGEWYKLAVTRTGIHKIDPSFLRKMGVDPNKIIPNQLQIYGNGGAMLPQLNVADQKNALTENAIWVQGQEDSKLNSTDAIFFYAEGPHVILFDSLKAELQHQINCYSDTSFYFLTFNQGPGLRVKNAPEIAGENAKVIDHFTDYWYHESESSNLLKSGREWFGEYLGGAPLTINADIPGVIPESEIIVRTSAIGAAQIATKFVWQLNGNVVGESPIGTVSSGTYDVKALRSDATFYQKAVSPAPASFKINIAYNKSGQGSAQAYLNYVALQVQRELAIYEKQQLYYFLPEKFDKGQYQFKNGGNDWNLWNVTNAQRPSIILNTTGNFSFATDEARKLSKYIGFKTNEAYEPTSGRRIANQDITSQEAPDLLIVTPKTWESEARRLAAFRETQDNLQTLVVTSEQIYNEFASGKPDLTSIRDFARMLYNKTPGKLKYLLLFGDATYDYRNKWKNQSQEQRNNWIPVYESRESLNPVYTYSSDDYFGFMENGEGEWLESLSGDHTMDIGVGRLPIKTVFEAKTIVDKLIRYESSRSTGNWKNVIKFVADDGDGNIHQRHADELAKLVQGQFMSSRLFVDEFRQATTNEGEKAPELNKAIRKDIERGTLILNYTGHGGVSGWAQEQILTLADMQTARGIDNMPLLFTATCDFGRYDDPGTVSGAELMVLSPKGAAIGAISTTRTVYSSTNFTLSKAFYESLVQPGRDKRMGDFFKKTKNGALVGSLNRNFALLGDPSMKLGQREKAIRWTQLPDTLRAMQKIVLKAEIFDQLNGLRDSLFDGHARITVYDKQTTFPTLGNEGNPESYSEFRSKLFDGNVTVNKGIFTCEFIVPKDIDLRIGTGLASIYATDIDSTLDAGSQLNLVIGGRGNTVTDNTPPEISAYLNNQSFRDGDVVNPSPILWIRVIDENGINISKTGTGHDITLVINDTLTIGLNDYFIADQDDYRSGMIRYPMDNLPTGKYVLRAKVWDTYTNFSEIAFGFLVEAADGIKVTRLNVYPNPFHKDLSFEMDHNRINEDLEVTLHFLLSTGQHLEGFHWQYYNSEATIRETLNLSNLGKRIQPNTMILYQMLIRSLKDNSTDQRSGKLISSP